MYSHILTCWILLRNIFCIHPLGKPCTKKAVGIGYLPAHQIQPLPWPGPPKSLRRGQMHKKSTEKQNQMKLPTQLLSQLVTLFESSFSEFSDSKRQGSFTQDLQFILRPSEGGEDFVVVSWRHLRSSDGEEAFPERLVLIWCCLYFLQELLSVGLWWRLTSNGAVKQSSFWNPRKMPKNMLNWRFLASLKMTPMSLDPAA